MKRALLGALLVAAGIATLIVASRHHPHIASTSGVTVPFAEGCVGAPTPASGPCPTVHLGWSVTAYDAVRIGGLALIVFGAVIVVFALVRELRRAPVPG